MKNELIENSIQELQNTKKLCQMLLESPHYKKIGVEGIYAIVETAKSVGVDPLQALNGGMFFVRGKVEMSARLMNSLIRRAGHSVTQGKETSDTKCVLHGKRADNGDEWKESFSMDDAKAAKLTNNPTWTTYRKDMLFARALSRLARQLFPDVIHGLYIQGELSIEPSIPEPVTETLGAEAAKTLADRLNNQPEYAAQVQTYLERNGMELKDLPLDHVERIEDKLTKLEKETDCKGDSNEK